MFKIMLSVATLVAATQAAGPTGPHSSFSLSDCEEGMMVVDNENMCWYHKCVYGARDAFGIHNLRLMPFRCALGSKISYNYIAGMSNPCTINFNSDLGYSCTRREQSVDGPPPCFADFTGNARCQNGGSGAYLANMCWCVCPPSWQGDWDCSRPTRIPDFNVFDNFVPVCVDGEPKSDFCSEVGGCLNGGSCYNQCDSFWCDCPNHEDFDYYGKRCELPPQN